MRVLFQGDSITDWGRQYEDDTDLGKGYVPYAARLIEERFPQMEFSFVNRGISGNRTRDLLARWQQDCIDIQPDVMSLLIGINDTWRRYDSADPMTAEEYEQNLRTLLAAFRQYCPQAKLLLMEPFLLQVQPEQDTWREDLDPKIAACRRVAREFADVYLPCDGLFAAASVVKPPVFWSADGVHPSDEGARLLASYYVQAFAELMEKA